ncbi:protein FAM222B [Corythoichthys intestinalis]|uniref:protein FAM222B n=1 Tax=Corythoichthys intestinalis TaxID=161448 RepID=UPI0025A643C1|nr:protein FAM222B [Corythoichthys intestinalis]XP_057676886.1 protein FAM222B [Corythoichthys intestinalis]XP_057676887.1 protein FAM222B [Corythoichthys intestinalis]XP_057676888.1 protein FAM222B [Corythoichthys intestinalis]XP_061801893.1 protein FAM222B [Nerophis lumbriciformis]
MLACLPGPGDLPLQLLPHTQMNTGLQKWDTTQRMRSTPFPTPAELDAYAKKVANNPLTIKIFPNSVKVPQRNHVRRTVNGLDTSGQRYSPYPSSQANAKTGLLAIVKVPAVKGILKDFAGSRARLHPEVIMNHLSGPYQVASTSTLNHPHPTLPNLPRPQQSLALSAQDAPQNLQMSLAQQQSLRHPLSMAQHSQGLPRLQTVSQHSSLGHPQVPSSLLLQQQHLQQPPGSQESRKLPEGDAPPNVTVSTSTIPLPMATGLHHSRQPDLSTIVHQINQFCQARAQGAGSASVCEGQIANPSPISRNLLISACSRVSTHNNPTVAGGFQPHNCILGPQEKATIPVGAHPLPSVTMNHLPSNHTDLKQPQHPQQHLHLKPNQQLQHKMRSWNQHQLSHVPHIPNGCKQPGREAAFHFKGMGYPADMCAGQPYMLKPPLEKPTPSPPVNNNGMTGPVAHYPNGHYFQSHVWNSGILPTPNSDSSGSQDVAMPFHGAGPGACAALDCGPPGAPHYRLLASSSAQTNLMQTADYMGGDFQTPYFRDQNLGLIGKMHRPPVSGVGPELGDGRGALVQHPGYR